MKLSKYEQETIINFNEQDLLTDVYTHNQKLIQKLEKMADDFPEECMYKGVNEVGGYRFLVSKRLVGIHLPHTKEWKERMSQKAKKGNWLSKGQGK